MGKGLVEATEGRGLDSDGLITALGLCKEYGYGKIRHRSSTLRLR
jgi:hypothetical protein